MNVPVKIVYTDTYPEMLGGLAYAKPGDSGFDLRASLECDTWVVQPGKVRVIKTGVKVAIPEGYELQVRTRSGSPLSRGFLVANSPGTVDSGYRGEVGVIVFNFSDQALEIEAGERIAQGVICPVYQADFKIVDELDETERGTGAYNSTGVM